MRRSFHLVLLIVIILVVRAYGGLSEAGYALGMAGRWSADRTGLTRAKQTWDSVLRQRIAMTTQSTSDALYNAASLVLSAGETGVGGIGEWISRKANSATVALGDAVRSVLEDSPGSDRDAPER